MQSGLCIKLLSLQTNGLMDAVGVVLLLDPPNAVPGSPAHLSCGLPVGIHQRNGCAQVVGEDVPDGQRVGILGVSLCFLEELQ
ncbi:hypothetical protein ASF19_25515 [Acidovorax sp. Leaf84]|nr:hypothetical protein ASF19_25515 [Acidovorax sp. Leaf84]